MISISYCQTRVKLIKEWDYSLSEEIRVIVTSKKEERISVKYFSQKCAYEFKCLALSEHFKVRFILKVDFKVLVQMIFDLLIGQLWNFRVGRRGWIHWIIHLPLIL